MTTFPSVVFTINFNPVCSFADSKENVDIESVIKHKQFEPTKVQIGLIFTFNEKVRKSEHLYIDKLCADTKTDMSGKLETLLCKKWLLLKYIRTGHFDLHKDSVNYKSHIGTILILPPQRISKYDGGDLLLFENSNEFIINSHPIFWTVIMFDLTKFHKVTEITNGTRYIFKSTLSRFDMSTVASLHTDLTDMCDKSKYSDNTPNISINECDLEHADADADSDSDSDSGGSVADGYGLFGPESDW